MACNKTIQKHNVEYKRSVMRDPQRELFWLALRTMEVCSHHPVKVLHNIPQVCLCHINHFPSSFHVDSP